MLDLWEQVSGKLRVDNLCQTSKQRNTHLKGMCAHPFTLSQHLPTVFCCQTVSLPSLMPLFLQKCSVQGLVWILGNCYQFCIFFQLEIPKPICLNFDLWTNLYLKADVQGSASLLIAEVACHSLLHI